MKKWLSAAIILLIQHYSFAQWQWLNPKPSGFINNSIIFTDAQNGYILNTNGDLLTTNNQGTSWQITQHFSSSVTALNIAYTTGVIVGYNNILLSTDNGLSWQKLQTNITDNFKSVDIVSRDTIFIASANSKLYKTTDRGKTWQTIDCGITIRSMDFANSKVGYVGASQQIRKTTDGGQTWTISLSSSYIPSGTLAIKFVTADTGYASREYDDILRTTDGGATWSVYTSGISGYLYTISFPSPLIGFMGGENGAMYRTQNGGVSWEAVSTALVYGTEIYSMYFINNDIGFAVGARGRILKTTNRGTTWQAYSPTYIDVTSLAFGSNTTGYATTWNNVYKTTDAGATWAPLAVTVGTAYADNSRFDHSHFFSADTGFVSANSPSRIYRTYDGGQNWQRVDYAHSIYHPAGYDNISDLDFVSRNTAYASFKSYNAAGLFKTTNGGDTWTEIGSNQDFTFLNFFDEKTGYASKYSEIYKTVDSGKTWRQVLQNIYGYQIQAICFINEKTGFYGDSYGLKRTNDSGKTWTLLAIGDFDKNIEAIRFFNNKVGYFTASGGAIYKTIDAGQTWLPETHASYYDMKSIVFNTDTTVYVAGMYGAILKSPIATAKVDSLQTNSLRSCGADLSAVVTAVFSTADSIQFEYGKNNFSSTASAVPNKVTDSSIKVTATAALQGDSSYQARLKYYYKGKYVYSDVITFKASSPAATQASVTQQPTCAIPTGTITINSPVPAAGITYSIDGTTFTNTTGIFSSLVPGNYNVTASNKGCNYNSATVTVNSLPALPVPIISVKKDTLISSISQGNQWYLNNIKVPGATGQFYKLTMPGSYSVLVTNNYCKSSFSLPYLYADSVTSGNIVIHSNPVHDILGIENKSVNSVKVQITDMQGRVRLVVVINPGMNLLNISNLSAGLYVLYFTDLVTNKTSTKLIMKR